MADTTNPWSGGVRYPNGAVYFPNYNGGTFVMPDGAQIKNGPTAKNDINAHLVQPHTGPTVTDSGGGNDQTPDANNPPAVKGGQPTPIDGGGGSPGPAPGGSKGGQPTGPGPTTGPGDVKGGQPALTPTTGTDPSNDPFSKGQPSGGATDPNAMFNPQLQALFQSGYNPYGGYPGGNNANAYGQTGGNQYYNPGSSQSYDPLGIGQSNYQNDQAYYPMTGVNAVNGYTGQDPRYAVVGGNGGYGIGMVGPDYTGKIWNDVPRNLINRLEQRQQLTNPTQAYAANQKGATVPGNQVPNKGGQPGGQPGNQQQAKGGQPAQGWGLNSPNAAKAAFAQGGGTRDDWRAQRAAGRAGTSGDPAGINNQGQPPGAAPGATNQSLSAPINPGMGPQGQLVGGGWGGYDPTNPGMLGNDTYNTKFGTLVAASGGNAGVYKVNGGDENDLYQYDPTHLGPGDDPSGWKHMTAEGYRSYGDHKYTSPFSDPNAYKAAGGQYYRYANPSTQGLLQKSGLKGY